MALYSHVILLNLTDAANQDLSAANRRLTEVLDQLNGDVEPGVTKAEMLAVSGQFDYVVLLDASQMGALVAQAALRQAGPAVTQTMGCAGSDAIGEAAIRVPLFKRTGPWPIFPVT